MIERLTVVAEREAVRLAGPGARVAAVGPVTYVHGPAARVLIIQAGDRPGGSAVDGRENIELRTPFPAEIFEWLDSHELPLLGFVRLHDGCLAIGSLCEIRRVGAGVGQWGSQWAAGSVAAGSAGSLRQVNLAMDESLPADVLDLIRPTLVQDLPGIEWLAEVPQDRAAALRGFLTGWYADVAATPTSNEPTSMRLPEPLADFYRLAAEKPVIYGVHNRIVTPGELQYSKGKVTIATENQGVWAKLIDPSQDDPIVENRGCFGWSDPVTGDSAPPPGTIERLSQFLLQFALVEAVMSAPFVGHATISVTDLAHVTERMRMLPLPPANFPENPTRIYVAQGLVAIAFPDEGLQFSVASRQRCALREWRNPGFEWDVFSG
ncbi:hypothetical protein BJY16_006621 [Actinoplanes octamycinicus]|uniref:Uncharacterized protein n=1 Tax=Actinoplanes octamycinicus TaxID=135948 RepID=A0A7W7MAM9_9ACTN|nr:hypothetical protein [Actinoplanes octamycinicus]MBB4743162.1 hypothetical protein [Actinoplanes octamycinicus]GIE61276.1 hypothetical protein Aoc01nite_66780 [Actinoplanes octamycinicus]